MSNPSLVFKHPREGVTILELENYRQTSKGGLAVTTPEGRHLTIGPKVEYVVEDWIGEEVEDGA